jgi:myo-inositol-1(or 4)-monophosphatase
MEYRETITSAVHEAGLILREEFQALKEYTEKARHDIVTRADYRSEKRIIEILRSAFTDYSIRAEESGQDSSKSDYCWYVDPLDGTSNFVTGNPYFAVSIGLVHHGIAIAGGVYSPISEEFYYAEKGQGASLNGKEIHVSRRSSLEKALMASAYAAEPENIVKGLRQIEQLALACRRVVINFAPSLDLCNIARGRLDALVDNGSTPEDHAAGSLILSEAGGFLRNMYRDSWDLNTTGIIAGNKYLRQAVLNKLKHTL